MWVPLPKAFPLGGRWPGAAGTDEGATGYPTEQKKTGVQAAGRWALVFYKERLRSHRPLISLLRRQLPPKGKPLDVAGQPPLSHLYETTPPARPAGGRAVTGVGSWAAGQAEKKRGPLQGPPKLEKVGPGRKNLFLPGVLSSGFLPKKAGPPPGAGRATGSCAPRHRKSPHHPKGTQYPAAPPPGTGRETTPQGPPCGGPEGTTYRQQRPPAPPGAPRSLKKRTWPLARSFFIPLLRGGLN